MKKQFLLLGMALASMGASAQHIAIDNLEIKAGEEGKLTFTISDVDDWSEFIGLEIRLMLPAGVKFGSAADCDFGGVWSDADITKNAYTQQTLAGAWMAAIAADAVGNSDVTGPVKMSVPVIVAEDATPGDYELDIETVEGQNTSISYADGTGYYFYDEDEYENATLTITSATAGYDATVYEAAGTSFPQTFANAASVEAYLSAHTNAIVAFASAVPDEIAAIDNVVVAGKAKSIVLTSQNEYPYTGEAFVAEKVSFEYWIGTKATKAGGWNSLAIPFTGTPEAKPFTAADKTTGEFWAKKFTGSTSEGLQFADLASAQFEANKSYLVAFPGSDYGVNEFSSLTLNITAEDATVYPAANVKNGGAPYSMTTVYAGYTPDQSYVLNNAGTKFELMPMQKAKPFTAFASAEMGAPALRSLAILDANQGITSAADAAVASTTVYGEEGEIVIIAAEAGVATVYNMNAQVVKANVAYNEGETRVAVAAGAYVVAGQVVIVK